MDTLLRIKRLIDGAGGPPLDNAELLVRDGRVVSVGRRGHVNPDGCAIRTFPDQVAVAGLIDLHTHFCYLTDGQFQRSPHTPSRVAMMVSGFRSARSWLEQGVTTARVVGTPFDLDIGLKELIVEQPALGPRLSTAGRMITMTGGRRNPWDFMKDEVSGAVEAQQWTRAHLKEGADVIKLYATTLFEEDVATYLRQAMALPDGAPDPGRWGSLTVEEIRAISREAHKAGRTVAAHTAPAFGIKLALRGGVDTVEHGSDLDDECIELFLETGATLVPTLSISWHQIAHGDELGLPKVYTEFARRRWERILSGVRRAYERGVKLGAGTDAILPGMVFWTEVELLVEAGLTPGAALHAATGAAAACMGMAGSAVGSLTPGKWADLVLLAADPLEDIRNIRKVTAVLKAGELVAGSDRAGGEELPR